MTRSAPYIASIVLLLSASHSAVAAYCEDGQMPAPPEIAARMALPLCGFAATKRWGPNGCQLCDPRNIYPNPYSYRVRDSSPGLPHAHRARVYE